jgi:hypothetical protein
MSIARSIAALAPLEEDTDCREFHPLILIEAAISTAGNEVAVPGCIVTPSCLRTTIKQSHARKRALASAFAAKIHAGAPPKLDKHLLTFKRWRARL